MRWTAVLVAGLCSNPAWAEGILDVLARSQQLRLQAMPISAENGEARRTLEHDFRRLRAVLAVDAPEVELRVVAGGTIAETIEGRVVVLHEALADWSPAERLFVLAHELGHVAQGHWAQLAGVYQRHIPGEVSPETTAPVAALLGREASGATHRHEFEADAYALAAVRRFGYEAQDVLPVFMRLGAMGDTATHPGVRRRVAQIRAIDQAHAEPSLAAN